MAGRHLPFSLMNPALHFGFVEAAEAKMPNFPFSNVSTQLNAPGSLADTVNVIAPVVGFTFALSMLKLLLGVAITIAICPLPDMSSDGSLAIGRDVTTGSLATAKDCCAWGAGSYSSLPGWSASILHVPNARKLTVDPESEQTEGVAEEKGTGRPEDAVAATVYVEPPTVAEPGVADVNAIVCDPLPTANDCCT